MAHYHTEKRDEGLKHKIQKKIRKNSKTSFKYSFKRLICVLRQLQKKFLAAQKHDENSYFNILYLILIILFCILMSSPLILVPQHDAIKDAKYWYEGIVAVQFSYTIVTTLATMMECKILFNFNHFFSIKNFGIMYGSLMLSQILLISTYYVIFVLYLNYNPPMPLSGLIGYLSYFISLAALWFVMPHEKRFKANQRKQYNIYVAYKFLNNFVLDNIGIAFTIMFKKTPSDAQWIMGFALLIMRELFFWLRRTVLQIAFDETRSNLLEIIRTNIVFAKYVAMGLATFVTESTGYVILSVDFAMNVWTAIKISRAHKKINSNVISNEKLMKNIKYNLSELALVEIIEFIVPINYIVTLVIAMYGPNSLILGNYGNGYWQFKPIESLHKYVKGALEMFFVDCCSFFVGSCILWRFCSINFLREVCLQIKKHGCFLAIIMAQGLVVVRFYGTRYLRNDSDCFFSNHL